MTARFNTARLTQMLALELRTEVLIAEGIAWDSGAGALAVAAIAASAPGPARDFEVARWADLLHRGAGRIAYLIRSDSPDAEFAALADLDVALRERFGWLRLADQRASTAGGAP